MARLLLVLVPLAIAFWVYSIVDCAMLPPTRHRGVSKPAWMLIVILLPILGGALWFVVGRGRTADAPALRAPDDDPAFLQQLGSQGDQDERIRRLEEELAQLDAEDDDPKWNPPSRASDDSAPGGAAGSATGDPRPGDADGDDLHGQRGALG
ncbi:MAG: PLD nuclease N-terminal domain-containing protein [Microbacterium sp.]